MDISTIGNLLRLAETGHGEEAKIAFAKAQKLASKLQISLDIARAHADNKDKREAPIVKHVTIGSRGKKGLKYYCRLFLAIADNNDVKCNIAHNNTYMVCFGLPSDIEMVEMLYGVLINHMVSESDAFLKSGEYKKDTVEKWSEKEWGYVTKPVDGRVARNEFQSSYVNQINSRLRDARLEAQQEAIEADRAAAALLPENEHPESDAQTHTELVLVNKAVELADFYKANSTARGTWGGHRGSSGSSYTSRNAGREAGSRARLTAQRQIG